ncbi:MAG: hypothetical protein LBH35_00165 [Treponema sp.]|nr:hypothetical protein [Treponema sp.]
MIKKGSFSGNPEKQGGVFLLTVLFILFAAVFPLYGGGTGEKSVIAEADRLIEEKQYTRALDLLTGFAAGNPDSFDEAQNRIQKIFGYREEYNKTAEELLVAIETTPDDANRILRLSNRLQELDPERIGETQNFIARVYEVALFRANRDRLETILAQGSEFIAQERFSDAMNVYTSGLDIYQTEFFEAGHGTIVEDQVRQHIGSIDSGLAAFNSLLPPLEQALAALENQRNQDISQQGYNALNGAYQQIVPGLDRLIGLRAQYAEAGENFQEQQERILQADPAAADRTFPAFALRLLEGPAGSSGEGMLGVIDTFWNRAAGRAAAALDEKAASAYAAVYTAALNQEYGGFNARLDTLASYISLPRNLIEQWGRYDPSTETLFDAQVPLSKAGDYAFYESELASIARYRALGALGLQIQSLPVNDTVAAWRAGGNAEALMTQERNLNLSIGRFQDESAGLGETLEEDMRSYAVYRQRFGEEKILSPFDNLKAALNILESQLAVWKNASLAREYTIANGVVETTVVQRETELQEGLALTRNEDSRRPSQAVTLLAALDSSIDAGLEAVAALIGRYSGENPESLRSPELGLLYNDAAAMRGRLESVRIQSRNSAAAARSLVTQAQNYSQEGERFFADARAALDQGNFERARDRLLRAGERFDSSLVIEDSPPVRQTRDVLIPQLDAEIARLENEAVIRDVNELIASARVDFNRGNFDIAEEKLIRAENRWNTTQTVENQEIRNWLNIIHGAVSSRSGRTIPPTAPLYAEMSQLLSEARKNYDEGLYYFGVNRRSDGLVRFNSAREKTQKVKLVYPLNETAGLLELRMDREQDPRAFEQGFSTRLQNAVAGTRQQSWQAFADLQNLFVINPNYPNRTAIIYEAEIAMGIRPPPPDPAIVAESNRLTAQARAVVNSNTTNEISLRQAQQAANRALELNPVNEEAARLASEIAVRIGGVGRLFDHATELKYNRAGELLQQNNFPEAYRLALEIADDPRYRNNSRLLDLLQRIRVNL